MKQTPRSNTVKVLLVEGRKLLREGLCALLERHDDIKVVGEVEDARSVTKLITAAAVDVVVLNVIPPQVGGVDLVSTLTKAYPEVRVVVLTMDPTPHLLRELVKVGAHGCLTKQSSATELVEAIRTVMTEKTYLSASLVDLMENGYAQRSAPATPVRPLAPREREILQRIAAGETTKGIARALGVGTKTVETHRRRMMHKLNKHSVAELTKYALREGLTTLESV
ncbi:MAG: response regulator transcription factor [Planctomycetota bacterium]|nr:response regulator transcription factor [Planctomycetota bacterium]